MTWHEVVPNLSMMRVILRRHLIKWLPDEMIEAILNKISVDQLMRSDELHIQVDFKDDPERQMNFKMDLSDVLGYEKPRVLEVEVIEVEGEYR